MPRFEHFPVQDILKEGVQDDCTESGGFGGGFDDWSLEPAGPSQDEDSYSEDYSEDYVQPTRKPLVFKKFPSKSPLSPSNGDYRDREDRIPDLPPPDSFPNLFQNLPAKQDKYDKYDNKISGHHEKKYEKKDIYDYKTKNLVPVPGSEERLLRRRRRQSSEDVGAPSLQGSGTGPGQDLQLDQDDLAVLTNADKDLLSVGEECEVWNVQKVRCPPFAHRKLVSFKQLFFFCLV